MRGRELPHFSGPADAYLRRRRRAGPSRFRRRRRRGGPSARRAPRCRVRDVGPGRRSASAREQRCANRADVGDNKRRAGAPPRSDPARCAFGRPGVRATRRRGTRSRRPPSRRRRTASGSSRRRSATGRPSHAPRSDSARASSTDTRAPVASATMAAVARARRSGEDHTAASRASFTAAASARACSSPSAESGGSRRPRIRPPALSAVWPCRASSNVCMAASGTASPRSSRRCGPPPRPVRRTAR